jgi:tetratricopeptide (TPR) repeat protein
MIAEGIKLLVNARKRELVLIAGLLALGLGARESAARQVDPSKSPPPPAQDTTPIDPSKPPPPPPGAGASTPSPDTKTSDVPASPPAAPTVPAFDPLHAQKSIDVGQYYLKTGNYPAAIDRFKEAIAYQGNLALPWDLLGEAYEKEHELDDAIAAYQKYLSLLPDGKEPDRVRKHLAKLQADAAHDAGKQSNK